jgi:hypothetical protein
VQISKFTISIFCIPSHFDSNPWANPLPVSASISRNSPNFNCLPKSRLLGLPGLITLGVQLLVQPEAFCG